MSSMPAPSRAATLIASTTTTTICQYPDPKKCTKTSPTKTPTATPIITSVTRRSRWPNDIPSEIIAVTGAKNGRLWCSTSLATHQAVAAPRPHWTMKNIRLTSRSVRALASRRERRAARARSTVDTSAVLAVGRLEQRLQRAQVVLVGVGGQVQPVGGLRETLGGREPFVVGRARRGSGNPRARCRAAPGPPRRTGSGGRPGCRCLAPRAGRRRRGPRPGS